MRPKQRYKISVWEMENEAEARVGEGSTNHAKRNGALFERLLQKLCGVWGGCKDRYLMVYVEMHWRTFELSSPAEFLSNVLSEVL